MSDSLHPTALEGLIRFAVAEFSKATSRPELSDPPATDPHPLYRSAARILVEQGIPERIIGYADLAEAYDPDANDGQVFQKTRDLAADIGRLAAEGGASVSAPEMLETFFMFRVLAGPKVGFAEIDDAVRPVVEALFAPKAFSDRAPASGPPL